MNPRPQALLFDLDGTLIDSAPDLAGTANDMRERRGMTLLPYARLRPMVGSGARGMVGAAFGVKPGDADFEALREEFLEHYPGRSLRETRVFGEVEPLLQRIESIGVPWGIVTNKIERYTLPIVDGLGLAQRAGAVVCGDTTPHAKPHPQPLLEAARRLGVAPQTCVYIGDDLRDVQAGRAAGMQTIAVGWGYLGEGEPIEAWGADFIVERPDQLLKLLALD